MQVLTSIRIIVLHDETDPKQKGEEKNALKYKINSSFAREFRKLQAGIVCGLRQDAILMRRRRKL